MKEMSKVSQTAAGKYLTSVNMSIVLLPIKVILVTLDLLVSPC